MDENELKEVLERYAARTDDYAVLVRRLVGELVATRTELARLREENLQEFLRLNGVRAKMKAAFDKLLGEV